LQLKSLIIDRENAYATNLLRKSSGKHQMVHLQVEFTSYTAGPKFETSCQSQYYASTEFLSGFRFVIATSFNESMKGLSR
jgi:hypothetical protein